ncbi:MAG: AAA family ATPase [Ekhidna sp.]
MINDLATRIKNLKPPYSDKDLLDLGITEIPYIIDILIPQKCLVLLHAESNIGKSTLLRQIAYSVGYGLNDFCGFDVKKNGKVLVLASEDIIESLSFYLNSLPKNVSQQFCGNVQYLLNGSTFRKDLKEACKHENYSLILVDAFGDVFNGTNSNSADDVRSFYNEFQEICNEHNCSVIFLHHNTKASENNSSHKNNASGSQAIQARPRVTMELKRNRTDNERILSFGKHNYISDKERKKRYRLRFENLHYSLIEVKDDIDNYEIEALKTKIEEIVLLNFDNGTTTLREIENRLIEKGFKKGQGIGRGTISSILKRNGRT